MKNTIRFILALTLLLLSLPLLSACGKSAAGEEEAGDGDVQLSNIVFSDMEMSEEEKSLMNSVQALLSEAVLDCSDTYGEKLVVSNTLDTPVDIYFHVLHFDRDDTIVGSAWLNVSEWRPNQKLNAAVSGMLDKYTPFDHASLAAQIVYKDHYLRTDYVPLRMRGNDGIAFTPGMELPVEFKAKTRWDGESTFLLTKLECVNNSLQVTMKKLSGGWSSYETIEYRILDRERSVIVGFGAFHMKNIEDGETFVLRDGTVYLELEPGEYIFEPIAGYIREAA